MTLKATIIQVNPPVIDYEALEANTSTSFADSVKESVKDLNLIGFEIEDGNNFYKLFVSTYGFSFIFRYGKQYRSIHITELDARHLKILHDLQGGTNE